MSEYALVPLRAVTLDAQTGPFGSQLHSDEYVEGGIPVINPSNLIDGKIVPDPASTVTEATSNRLGCHQLNPGDIVFARRGELGRAAVVHNEASGWLCGTGSLRIRPQHEAFISRFAEYVVQSASTRAYFEMNAVGTTMGNLNTAIVLGLPVPLPPPKVQAIIADFLAAATARIDRLQEIRDRQFKVLEELVASRISAVVPNQSKAPFVRLGYLAVIQSGITVDSTRDSGTDTVTLPYLRVANVQDGHVDLESISEITVPRSATRSSLLRHGDVLMTEGGDLDKLGRGTVWLDEIKNCLHQNHVFAVRPDQRKLTPEYLALITRSSYARAYFESTGTKTTNLASTNSSKIRDFKIPLIDPTAQIRVAREVDGWLKDIAKAQAALTQQRAILLERRQALITAAVTGQIDVTMAGGVAV